MFYGRTDNRAYRSRLLNEDATYKYGDKICVMNSRNFFYASGINDVLLNGDSPR